jgi:hypothetical protein
MRIMYTNIADDFIALTRYQLQHALTRYQLQHAPSWVRWTNLLKIPLAVFVVWMLFTIWQSEALWFALLSTVILGPWVLLTMGRDRILAWLSERHIRRMERGKDKPANAEYFREYDLELDGGQLIDHKPRGAFTVSLKSIGQVTSTPEHTFIVGPVHFYVIPRRTGPEGQYEEFVEALRDQWAHARA